MAKHYTVSRGPVFFPESNHPANIDPLLAAVGAVGVLTSVPVQLPHKDAR